MSFQFKVIAHPLKFKFEAGTSRGSLLEKPTYFIHLTRGDKEGWGEVSLIPKLSPDADVAIVSELTNLLTRLQKEKESLDIHSFLEAHCSPDWPAIKFGIETAWLSLYSENPYELFKTPFTEGLLGIPINGLIWMGDYETMVSRVEEKLSLGFRCIKLKIGAINWKDELDILKQLRTKYSLDQLTIRVDANGAFNTDNATNVLKELSTLYVHSIEQPIKPGQIEDMRALCLSTPCPIALDEELIGVHGREKREQLLQTIKPQYIILKPSLLGGLRDTSEWIELAEANGVGWWITSALESNIGLNAIAQFASTFDTEMYQGLGTGGLYHNNVDAPLVIKGEELFYDPKLTWSAVGEY